MSMQTKNERVRSLALNRRRMMELALAGGATAVALRTPLAFASAQDAATPAATPTSAATTAAEFPIPGTLDADASPEFRTVADALVAAMQRHRVPGVALGILAGDREEHVTFGVASMSSLAPVLPETRFAIGSLSKTFTATGIWHLHDRGAIDIDAPVRTYLPDFQTADPSVAEIVQVGNLLDHTAGWYGDEGFETGNGDDAVARYVTERVPELPQQFPLGSHFSYNNAGFSILGRLIEVTTGTTYRAAMRDMLFQPLGLGDTVLARSEVLSGPYADGHYAGPVNGRDVLTVQTPLWAPRSVDPAGGIWSTTRDVIRYARFHLAATTGAPSSSESVVSAESLLQMQEPVIAADGLAFSMGRDWFLQDIDGVKIFSHNGDMPGQHTEFFVIPEHNFAFILLTNGASGASVALDVIEAALANYPGLSGLAGKLGVNRAVLASPDVQPVTLPAETLADYAGHYADKAAEYAIAVDGDHLVVETTVHEEPGTLKISISSEAVPFPVSFAAKDEGLAGGALRMPFVRDDAGKVAWISLGFRLIPKVD